MIRRFRQMLGLSPRPVFKTCRACGFKVDDTTKALCSMCLRNDDYRASMSQIRLQQRSARNRRNAREPRTPFSLYAETRERVLSGGIGLPGGVYMRVVGFRNEAQEIMWYANGECGDRIVAESTFAIDRSAFAD